MMDLQNPLNTSFEGGGFMPNVDGELIKENIRYPRSFDDDIYNFFRSVDFMSGALDGEGNMAYFGLSPQIQEHYQFNITEKFPREVLCEMSAPVFVEMNVGNVPELAREICDFYTDNESIDGQSNKVCEFHGDYFFIVPSNTLLSIHADNNKEAKTFQYLITKKSPVPFGGDPPTWFKGAGHGDDVYLIFNVNEAFPSGDQLDDENSLSDNTVQYWSNFAKFG
jgi:carboxylesterase type B